MKKTIIILNLIILFMSPNSAFCLNDLWTDKEIYLATKEACLAVTPANALGSTLESDNYRAGIFPSNKFNRLLMELAQGSFKLALSEFQYKDENDELYLILQNPGFTTALNECYPQSTAMKTFFIKVIHKTDLRGKVLAGATTVFLLKGTNSLLAKFGSWGKRVFNGLTYASIALMIKSIYNDYYNHANLDSELAQICGDKNSKTYSNCVAKNYQQSLTKIENDLKTQNELNKNLNSELVLMAKEQVKTLEKSLTTETSAKKRAEILANLEDRRSFIQEFSNK